MLRHVGKFRIIHFWIQFVIFDIRSINLIRAWAHLKYSSITHAKFWFGSASPYFVHSYGQRLFCSCVSWNIRGKIRKQNEFRIFSLPFTQTIYSVAKKITLAPLAQHFSILRNSFIPSIFLYKNYKFNENEWTKTFK